ncbi:methylation-associated defense system DNA methyltransferase MAD2 [Vibrio owensii]|uniref:methylation-associated defense system DNA methyltransferase MAD2 n=1 Tax=Vibrio owensii TaxID=696485 RepID=UPI0040677FE2
MSMNISSQVQTIEEGKVFDYITNKPVKDTPKERVRQRIARALLHEDGINVEDMHPDFKMKVNGKMKKVDIAIFLPGTEHVIENLERIVICEKEPKISTKGAYKMRDHDQAKKDFELLHLAMSEAPESCEYGLWTNGLDFFFFQKVVSRFDVNFSPMGHWPAADGTIGTKDVHSDAKLRKADPDMLRTAFRRCHNFIHGNEGMPKDAAFWQFLRLIYCKMYDEGKNPAERRFYAGFIPRVKNGQTVYIDEQFDDEGRKAIRDRIQLLFEDVKKAYSNLFDGTEQITLSDRALAFMVAELGKYEMRRADVDAKGAAYQEIVGTNLRGDRGQYFTPRSAIKLVVEMLDPQEDEVVLDPSCGTGGFLVESVNHQLRRFRKEADKPENTEEFLTELERIKEYVANNVFGADFDPFLVKATSMNMTMAANDPGNLFHMDSLSFPKGHLSGVESAKAKIPFGSVDVLMTNPPFGSDIPITDPAVLGQFNLAGKWDKKKETGVISRGEGYQKAVAPEVLFIERAIKWMKPGGRAGIVLPDGILGNPGDEYIRKWILRHCWVLASVDLPVETFIAEANVNILTSLLFLKKKTQEEIQAADLGQETDYPVFMAVAEKVGVDRRGNTLYKRGPDGEELLQDVTKVERVRIKGELVERTLHRKEKIVDNDLIEIGKAYLKFRKENPEPGA